MSYFHEISLLMNEVQKQMTIFLDSEQAISVPRYFDAHEDCPEDWLQVNYIQFVEGELCVGSLGSEFVPIHKLSPTAARMIREAIS
jgi:hypothetical protein